MDVHCDRAGQSAVWRFVAADADAVDPRRRGEPVVDHAPFGLISRVDDGLRDGPAPVCSSGPQTPGTSPARPHCLRRVGLFRRFVSAFL